MKISTLVYSIKFALGGIYSNRMIYGVIFPMFTSPERVKDYEEEEEDLWP